MALPTVLALFQGIGLPEILIILAVVLLLFGGRKIPELARSLGKARSEYQRGEREGRDAPDREREEEELRAKAKALGIPTEGKSLDELRREVARRP